MSVGAGLGETLSIDTTEIMEFAWQMGQATRLAQRELLLAMHEGVIDLHGDIRDLTPRCRTGNLQDALERRIRQGAGSIEGRVEINEGKAPYAKWVIRGRGPVRRKRAKALRLVFCDGSIAFRQSVGPAAGNDFLSKGFRRAQPGILRRFEIAEERIVAALTGKGGGA